MGKDNQDQVEVKRHSAAHVLAAAVMELYPEAKLGIGPAIDNGFYYDIQTTTPITTTDLPKIEKRMRKIMQRNEEFRREEMSIDEAIKFFAERGQDFKVELLKSLKEKGTTRVSEEEAGDIGGSVDTASVYWNGEFADLCRGPHVPSTKEVGQAFKLTKAAGAYWRGNSDNPMLTRVYGLLFETKEDLDAHLKMLEEAEKRDHRKLGQELDLFAFSPLVGSGLPLFTERGVIIREELEKFVNSLQVPLGYKRVRIPHIAKTELYKTSGHWDKFEDDLFHVRSKKTDDEFVLKPMNCPHHTQIYASQPRSYRDLPIRMSEVTMVYRDENTGQLQGLSRVRSITQDDAHVFCAMDQVEQEVKGVMDIIRGFYEGFGMPLSIRLSVDDPETPEKYLGDKNIWEKAIKILEKVIRDEGHEFEVGIGEAAFYGPKLDFVAKDAIGREWQLATCQLDFNMPERFGLTYMGEDGEKHQPVMIHRAILGSFERFMAILIEHYAGAFPAWFAPVQVQVIPVGKDHWDVCRDLEAKLRAEGIRVGYDELRETVGYKVRKAEKLKIPYALVIGDKEKSLKELNVRIRGEKDEVPMGYDEFVKRVKENITERKAKP
ncbi:MAG: threonine--tRNA ligase [Patescibacteria group bacterium]|nr:threonine--tRNA ligase [Patescibacteria group bacterium]